MFKRIIALSISFMILLGLLSGTGGIEAKGDGIEITSSSAILMEASTGEIIFEKNSDAKSPPASITKIMTLILIFEALDRGDIKLDEMITTSGDAAKMGGSNVYLEEGETLSVDDMIKCIAISSANDASYAMGERIGGTIEGFVGMMNNKAKELGMKNTHFVNCHGLDDENHYSTARDVAIMSRELIVNHPEISKYSTTWMDSIIHKTKRGEKEFGLSNTNKLIRTYDGITGLKTGSTSKAGYCLSATAKRSEVSLISVVMNSKDHKTRFSECKTLLDYGFTNCKVYVSDCKDIYYEIKVNKGKKDKVYGKINEEFQKMFIGRTDFDKITYETNMLEDVTAPIDKGMIIGQLVFYDSDKEIGTVDIYATTDVERMGFLDCIKKITSKFLL